MATCPTCRTRYPDTLTTCANDGELLLDDAAFAAAESDLAAGEHAGEYVIETKLGEGGFGSVYRAVHPLIGKKAAVKVLHRSFSSNPKMVARFIAEARAVNQIKNRNIIDIFGFGSLADGRQYFAMELLEGETLHACVDRHGTLPPEVAIPILRGVARAIDAAHAAGIAHRDLKPDNIFLVTDEDGNVVPKILDFGIAKLMNEPHSGAQTKTGTPMGTPAYMSPEQCRGLKVDTRTDIYSFGIVCHELLTGYLPFVGESMMDVLVQHTNRPAPAMSRQNGALKPGLDAAVLHMLEKRPESRPASLTEAVNELTAAAMASGYDVLPPQRSNPHLMSGGYTPLALPSSGAYTPVAISPSGMQPTPAEIRAISQGATIVADVIPGSQVSPPGSKTVSYKPPRGPPTPGELAPTEPPPAMRPASLVPRIAMAAGACVVLAGVLAFALGRSAPHDAHGEMRGAAGGAAVDREPRGPALDAPATSVAMAPPTPAASAPSEPATPSASGKSAAPASGHASAKPPGAAKPTKPSKPSAANKDLENPF